MPAPPVRWISRLATNGFPMQRRRRVYDFPYLGRSNSAIVYETIVIAGLCRRGPVTCRVISRRSSLEYVYTRRDRRCRGVWRSSSNRFVSREIRSRKEI